MMAVAVTPQCTNQALRSASFEAEALPHMNDLFRAAASMLRNREEAEDAVQEAYLVAWKSFHRFTPGTNCRAWLFQILFNVVRHRRQKWFTTLRWLGEQAPNLEETLVYEPPVPENLTDEDVLEAFQKVPAAFSEVVMLADVQEFSYKEIAEALGIPIGTVMSRLSRGRRQLRAFLAPTGPRQRIEPARAANPIEHSVTG